MEGCSDRVMALCISWLKKSKSYHHFQSYNTVEHKKTRRIAMSERIIHYGGGMSYRERFSKIVGSQRNLPPALCFWLAA